MTESNSARQYIGASAIMLLMFCGVAAAETYFADASMEISGSGERSSRRCKLVLLPVQTFGPDPAPRLQIEFKSIYELAAGLDEPSAYVQASLIQNNTRKPLSNDPGMVTTQQFLWRDLAKSLKSRGPFFVTAKRTADGQFVSSRFGPIDFDVALAKVEANCPFDAESLMSDAAILSRERAEQSLNLSESDMRLIRWALSAKYSGSSKAPEDRARFSSVDRSFLKRYAIESGRAASLYLNAQLARALIAEGVAIQKRLAPSSWNSIAADVWRVNGIVRVAIGYSGIRSSASEAEGSAIASCRSAGGPNCKSQGVWSQGCVYITVGTKRGQAGWASAAEIEATLQRCQANGWECKTPIGGCIVE